MRYIAVLTALAWPVGGEVAGQLANWRLTPSTFEVGGMVDDENYSLNRVVGATRLDDGRVVIADHFAQGLRAFDPSGGFLKQVGGEGEGPEEFQWIRGLGDCVDRHITAFDIAWDQKIYDMDLDLVETRPSTIPGLVTGASALTCAPSGYMVAIGQGISEGLPEPGYHSVSAPLVLVRDGEIIHHFGDRLSAERVFHPSPDGRGGDMGPHPFGRRMSLAIAPGRIYVGDGSEHRVEVYDQRGRALAPIRWSGPSREITRSALDAHIEGRIAEASDERRPDLRRRFADMPELERFPAYDRLATDADANLWVRHFRQPGDELAEWRIFDPQGVGIGTLAVPVDMTLLEMGSDYVLLVQTDEFDVETVRLMDLVKQ